MAPKYLGIACYYLIISSLIFLIATLIASQGFSLLYFSSANLLGFDLQIALALAHSLITMFSAYYILKGRLLGRRIWHSWSLGYFLVNLWQFEDRLILLPQAASLMIIMFLVYSKPAQLYFDAEQKRTRKPGKRVDDSFNIFDD